MLRSYGYDVAGSFLDLPGAGGVLATLPSYGRLPAGFPRWHRIGRILPFSEPWPHWRRKNRILAFHRLSAGLGSYRLDAVGVFSDSIDLAHGVVEGQAEDLDMEVNGVAGEVSLGPAPIAVFYDQAGIGGQNEIARLACDEFEAPLLQERNQRGQPGGADLLARPARCLRTATTKRWVGHSLSSSGVG